MTGARRKREQAAANKRGRLRTRPNTTDFSKIGGLSNHIKLLREIIIFPLLYADLYKHFNVKAPRGVLFFGPPGTGKTLVAGALATELNREGNGKVTFYQRKGADILDKWVGESERKLRDLFNQATRTRPSVIFFDELDGLAPIRSQKNDQIHSSIVATLLALMDGLDNMPGVIIIGATNRIDAIDPALRRPGRFDRELYFPLPSVTARKEILRVHTSTWQHKPSQDFLYQIAELTSGCCGSDLQALCAEAVLCSLKRQYPTIHKPKIGTKVAVDVETMVVEDIDFLNARMSLVPTSQRLGDYRVRKLSPFIQPLLQRQLDKIIRFIHILLPQFTKPFKKFLIGSERYAGRLVLKGANQQGLTVHIVPAILQTLEHIPCYMLDIPALFESNIKNARQNLPSILVLSRVDDWWDLIDTSTQLGLTAMLEDLHAGLPLFLIATCSEELPNMLKDYFYSNSSIVIKMDDPTIEERENFFAPLFFGNGEYSVARIMRKEYETAIKQETGRAASELDLPCKRKRFMRKRKLDANDECEECPTDQNCKEGDLKKKRKDEDMHSQAVPPKRLKRSSSVHKMLDARLRGGGKHKNCTLFGMSCCKDDDDMRGIVSRSQSNHSTTDMDNASTDQNSSMESLQGPYFNHGVRKVQTNPTLVDLINCSSYLDGTRDPRSLGQSEVNIATLYDTIKREPKSETSLNKFNPFDTSFYVCHNTNDPVMAHIYNLWKRTAHVSSANLPVAQLEMLYDIITACIVVNRYRCNDLIPALEQTLSKFEDSAMKNCI